MLSTATGIRLVSAGVAIIDHVNHVHVYKDTPRLLDATLGSSSPTEVKSNGAHVLASFASPAPHRWLWDQRQPQAVVPVAGEGLTLPLPDGLLQVGGPGAATFIPTAPSTAAPTVMPVPGCDSVLSGVAAGRKDGACLSERLRAVRTRRVFVHVRARAARGAHDGYVRSPPHPRGARAHARGRPRPKW
ncbi:MAG: hypothetical protein KA712_10425 [Myxococcales bacterium]|nr:hypothetical protein [Myxococcales bacterium]